MSTEAAISRRLAAVEAKVRPKLSMLELQMSQNPKFSRFLGEHGVSVDDFKRKGLGALPRDFLRALVERLKVANAAGCW